VESGDIGFPSQPWVTHPKIVPLGCGVGEGGAGVGEGGTGVGEGGTGVGEGSIGVGEGGIGVGEGGTGVGEGGIGVGELATVVGANSTESVSAGWQLAIKTTNKDKMNMPFLANIVTLLFTG
jgi:hypothetical protein